MRITNNANLPEAIVKAIENDPYDKGDADYSVTGLLNPGYMLNLQQKYFDEMTIDASDKIFSLFGQLIHKLFERADLNVITEKRFNVIIDVPEIGSKKISGQVDVINGRIIQDYKLTTLYRLTDLNDYIKQLNMYRYLCARNGIYIDKLQVVLIFRDWYKTKAQLQHDYPQQQVKIIDLPVWSIEEAEAFIIDRIKAIEANTPCTDTERWATGGNFAVMKKGKKRAIKLHDSLDDAEAHAKNSNDLYVQERPKTYKRCENYCTVSQYCEYYKKEN